MIQQADFIPDVEYFQSPFRNRVLKKILEAKEEILISTPDFSEATASLLKQIILSKDFSDPFDLRILTQVNERTVRTGSVDLDAILESMEMQVPPELSLSLRSILNLELTFLVVDAESVIAIMGEMDEDSFKGSMTAAMQINDEDMITQIISDFDRMWRGAATLRPDNVKQFRGSLGKLIPVKRESGKGIGPRLPPAGEDVEDVELRSMEDMVYELLEEAENYAFDEDYKKAVEFIDQALAIGPKSVRGNYLKGKFLYENLEDLDGALVAFTTLVDVNENHEEGHFYRGMINYDRKKDIDALEAFDKVTMINPDNEKAWHYKGVLLARAFKKYDDAIKCLDMAIKLEPYLDVAWLEKGKIFYENLHKVDEALRYLQGAIRINPENYDVQNLKARILFKEKGDSKGSLKVLKKVLKKDSTNEDALELIREVLEEDGNPGDALEFYENALKEEPDSLAALLGKGNVLYKAHSRYDEALGCFKKVLSKDIGNTEALVGIAKILVTIEKYQEALRVLDETLNLEKENEKALYLKAHILTGMLSKHNEALKILDTVTRKYPKNAKAWYEKGHIFASQFEKYSDAICCFDKSLRLDPKSENTWYDKGLILSQNLNDPQGALICFDEATKVNPDFDLAWYDKGIVLCSYYNRFEDAVLCFNKVLEINPNDQDAWYNKGNALADIGRYEEAVSCFDNTLSIDPDMWQAWGNKGNILDTLGRYQEAITCFDKAIQLNPNDETAWYNKGNTLINLNRYRDAIQCFEMTLNINPLNDLAEKNRVLCYNNLRQRGYYS